MEICLSGVFCVYYGIFGVQGSKWTANCQLHFRPIKFVARLEDSRLIGRLIFFCKFCWFNTHFSFVQMAVASSMQTVAAVRCGEQTADGARRKRWLLARRHDKTQTEEEDDWLLFKLIGVDYF
jgi:hypothetical protein